MSEKRKCHSNSNSFVAAAQQVHLEPVLERQVGTSSRSVEADLSLRRCGMSATHVNDDAKCHGGAEPYSARYVSIATLNVIHSDTRSQWTLMSVSVM